MKFLIALLLVFSASSAQAQITIVDRHIEPGELGFLPSGVCYPLVMLQYQIVRKLDATHYEMMGIDYMSPHAILETKRNIQRTGSVNFWAQPVKSVMMPLENGFSAQFEIYKDCKPPRKT